TTWPSASTRWAWVWPSRRGRSRPARTPGRARAARCCAGASRETRRRDGPRSRSAARPGSFRRGRPWRARSPSSEEAAVVASTPPAFFHAGGESAGSGRLVGAAAPDGAGGLAVDRFQFAAGRTPVLGPEAEDQTAEHEHSADRDDPHGGPGDDD